MSPTQPQGTDLHPAVATALSGLPTGIAYTDAKQRITFVNDLLCVWLGYRPEQLVGKRRFYDLLSMGGKVYFETHHGPILELSGSVSELNYELVDSQGRRHPALVNATKRKDALGYTYVIIPFSDRKEYEKELKRARKAAEDAGQAQANFLSTMSHEIRTPLHAILESGNFLLKENPRPDQVDLINALRSAGNNLLLLVNDILDINKMQAGQLELAERPFHFVELINEVVAIYGPQCRKKGLYLNASAPPGGIPVVLGDRSKILQVMNNLVSNAVKFCAEGGISVALEHKMDKRNQHIFNISVHDTGIGIPTDRQQAIFSPFVQASKDTFYKFGGTGLGLPICQRILQAAGSQLELVSEEGIGTTFSFELTLPAAPESDQKQRVTFEPSLETSPLGPLNHLTIANVDDNQANLIINARYFREWKVNFDQYESALDLLEALKYKRYDVILTDIKMPKMSGLELARAIRQHPNPDINALPIVALSASASRELNPSMLAAGINALASKPFEPKYLHQLILRLGDEHKGRYLKKLRGKETHQFSEVRELFAGDEEEYYQFLSVVATDLENLMEEVMAFSTDRDHERLRGIVHNTLTTVRLFKLDDLGEKLESARQLSESGRQVELTPLINQIHQSLKEFVQILKEKTTNR